MIKVHSYILRVVWVGFLIWPYHGYAGESLASAAPPGSDDSTHNAETVSNLIHKSSEDLDGGELDNALREVDAALQLDSHNSGAYELRGSIYIQKKLWDRAEDDYSKALELDPSASAFKYKLAEIKFLQKDYYAARPRYIALQSDASLGDLATYKVFLCDLLTAHETLAAKELEQIDKVERRPSYYFCNAAWDLFHHKAQEANAFFNSAATTYSSRLNELYLSSLKELNNIHAPVASFVTKDGIQYNQVKVFVENTGLRVLTTKGWMTVPFEQLPGDLSTFPLDLRGQIEAKLQIAPDAATGMELLTFTTKKGKQYDQVKWSIDDNGLRVLTSEGRITVPFEQLPDDLSTFPAELRERISAKRQSTPDTITGTPFLTFTTKKGKQYDRVEWSIDDNGLRVLTSDGWVSVPFEQLPDDLSSFPVEFRERITAKLQSLPDPTIDTPFLTFTTKRGRQYDQVKWSIDDAGLRILTSDGWITVPFEQLSDDLSQFPAEVRERIVAKRGSAPDTTTSTPFLTFTTLKGKYYEQVKWSVDDDGLRILTSDGWMTVPFEQLPTDLSTFPVELRKVISAKRKAAQSQGKPTSPPRPTLPSPVGP